jgi:serine/threonine protein kinase
MTLCHAEMALAIPEPTARPADLEPVLSRPTAGPVGPCKLELSEVELPAARPSARPKWKRNRPPSLQICPKVDILTVILDQLNMKSTKSIDTLSSSVTIVASQETGLQYVVKIGKPDEQHTFAEYDTLRSLNHACIPQAHAFFTSAGRHGILIQYMDGASLDQSMPTRGSAGALGLARQLLSAVAHAHESGIVHRDISHDNIVFDGEKLGLIDWNYSRCRSGTRRRWPETEKKEGLFVRPELSASLKRSPACLSPLRRVPDVVDAVHLLDLADHENGTSTTPSMPGDLDYAVEKFEAETMSTVAATTSTDIGSPPTSPFCSSFDSYGKLAYRASAGQEGDWYQQDAYACGLILRDLQGGADTLEKIANGLLAPPHERLTASDALDILDRELEG